jgi:light-regulated signal transduction histidine kinase (bacteriophytochrome)
LGLRDVPVILLTSLSSIQDIAAGLECGADNFIRKPYEPRNLLTRIDYILSNLELRKSRSTRLGLEIRLAGKQHFISSEREQILDLLVSSYEEAVQMNEQLKLREAELEAKNKELESFTYSVSHDLRSPLRTIDGFSHMLEEDHGHELGDEGRRLLTAVRESARRMGQIIEDLLELSRLGRRPLSAAEVDMTTLAGEALGELRRSGIVSAANCVIDPLPPAFGDPSLLRQVWINLLSNAHKYSSTRDNPAIHVSGYVDPTEIVYRVGDNGVGFDMRHYKKLFGVFQRLHDTTEFPGTGVGLAIVQRIVARHGGRVWAKGKVNEGATFFFALPQRG